MEVDRLRPEYLDKKPNATKGHEGQRRERERHVAAEERKEGQKKSTLYGTVWYCTSLCTTHSLEKESEAYSRSSDGTLGDAGTAGAVARAVSGRARGRGGGRSGALGSGTGGRRRSDGDLDGAGREDLRRQHSSLRSRSVVGRAGRDAVRAHARGVVIDVLEDRRVAGAEIVRQGTRALAQQMFQTALVTYT